MKASEMTPATEALVERLEAGARQNIGRYYGDMSGAIVSHDLLTEAAAALRAQGDEMKRMQARLDRWEPKITSATVSVSYGVGGNNAPLSADHVSDPRQMVSPPPAGEE